MKTRLQRIDRPWPKPLAKLNKLKQSEIAEMLGKHQPIISMWFSGKYLISASNLIRLSNVLDVDPEVLGRELLSRWADRLKNKSTFDEAVD